LSAAAWSSSKKSVILFGVISSAWCFLPRRKPKCRTRWSAVRSRLSAVLSSALKSTLVLGMGAILSLRRGGRRDRLESPSGIRGRALGKWQVLTRRHYGWADGGNLSNSGRFSGAAQRYQQW